MSRKFATFATAGLVALVAGPALPAPGGKNSEIEDLKNRVTALEGTVGTLQGQVDTNTGQVGTNTGNIGLLDQAVADILLTLAGVQDQLDSLDGRLTTVEEDIHSPLFDIVGHTSSHLADPLGVFIYQDCAAGEMALGGSLDTPTSGEVWVVDDSNGPGQGFHWSGDGNWATGWAANVIGEIDDDVSITAVCATVLALPAFGQNPLTNN